MTDLAIVTVLPEEAEAVRAALGATSLAVPTPEMSRNLYAWETGEIASSRFAVPYTVVTAHLGSPGTTSGYAGVLKTIETWRPRYVLLVGIAGGLKPGLAHADVVVSSEIYGYEYGKIAEGAFMPRPNLVYPGNDTLRRAAVAYASRAGAAWSKTLCVDDLGRTPRVEVGPVASGDKVVDDRSAPFFARVRELWGDKLVAVEMEGVGAARAEKDAREMGIDVGFLMVRGISDLPSNATPAQQQTDTRDRWKVAAARAAATFAIELVREAWPVAPQAADANAIGTERTSATSVAKAEADAPTVPSRSWWGWMAAVAVTAVIAVVVYDLSRQRATPLPSITEAPPGALESSQPDDLRLVDVGFVESDKFPILDVKVRNVGRDVIYLKRLELVVHNVWKIKRSAHPSAVGASWTYDVMLPLAPSDRPVTVSASQAIAPNGVDRFLIRLGNDGTSASVVYVFHVSLALVYNENDRRLVSRPILFTARAPFDQEAMFPSSVSPDVHQRNLAAAREIQAIDGFFSEELLALLASLEAHGAP